MSTQESTYKKKYAFTLAEVLITLGIIGVVAAMTLPTLMQNYQKKLVIERLKVFSSQMQQAARMRSSQEITDNVENMDSLAPKNPDDMLNYFNIYLKPYIKVSDVRKGEIGLHVKLANGSAMYMQKVRDCGALTGCTYIVFCPQSKHCDLLKEDEYSSGPNSDPRTDGKTTFLFWHGGLPDYTFKQLGKDRDWVKDRAKTLPTYCTSLIYYDGWEIKDDNPCWQ